MQNQPDLLTDTLLEINFKRRKSLLPWWVKVFSWIFIVFACLVPIGFVFRILGKDFLLSIYGPETNDPVSLMGIFISSMFLLKGFIGYGLISEKSWAITFAIIDAYVGIIVCVFMLVLPFIINKTGVVFSFRLELILLIPYLLKMQKIKHEWSTSQNA